MKYLLMADIYPILTPCLLSRHENNERRGNFTMLKRFYYHFDTTVNRSDQNDQRCGGCLNYICS